MTRILLITLTLIISATTDAQELSESAKSGEQIFQAFCAGLCHQAPDARRLKPEQWKIVLNTMQVRMQSKGLPPFDETQLQQLLSYLREARELE